jgi:splicing factor 3A subunit 3
VDYLITSITETEELLISLYNDENHAMKDELDSMRGPNMFNSFYRTLKNINEYHHKYPNIPNTEEENLSTTIPEFESLVQFSGEEIFGKYLDLHSLYVQYCNLPNIVTTSAASTASTGNVTGIQSLDYLQYLDKFNSFFYIPEAQKMNKAYGEYVTALWNYLKDFFHRIQPLVDINEYLEEWKKEFIDKWNQGQIMGWKVPRKIVSNDRSPAAPTPLRLGIFNSSEELEALGLERLKEGLEALGLKCGGTLSERAKRLWSVRGKKQEEIPANLKAKKTGSVHQNGDHDKENVKRPETFISLGTGDDGRRQVPRPFALPSLSHRFTSVTPLPLLCPSPLPLLFLMYVSSP